MKILAVAAIVLALNEAAFAQGTESYLCIPDKSTGFSFDETTHQWNYARFSISGKKYILKSEANGWSWSEFGNPHSAQHCDLSLIHI